MGERFRCYKNPIVCDYKNHYSVNGVKRVDTIVDFKLTKYLGVLLSLLHPTCFIMIINAQKYYKNVLIVLIFY